MMSTLVPCPVSSRWAFTAPAWMDFQNSCVVPFGMTAIVKVLPSDFFPQPASAMSAIVAASERKDFMAGGYCNGPAFSIPGPLRFLQRFVDAKFLQLGVDGLGET